jgi:hypothetical protein
MDLLPYKVKVEMHGLESFLQILKTYYLDMGGRNFL